MVTRDQSSAKQSVSQTLIPSLQRVHDRLSDQFVFYRAWHSQPGAIYAHSLVGIVSIVLAATVMFQSISIVRAANSCVSAATGSWSAPATWTSCGGTFPGAADTVTILTGHIVTVDVDSAAASVVINANAAAGGNGITIAAGKTLAVTGAVTMTAPTAATSNVTVGSGFLTAASIAIPGSATAGRFNTVSVSTGVITTTGNISFSGTAAQARFTSTGASAVNIGGNFTSGGTLTTSGTGTINFNGSIAQTIGAYITYNNVEINNTSGGVSYVGTTTVNGTLLVNVGTLDTSTVTSVVSGATTVNGTLLVSSTAGTKTFGDLTIATGGTMSFTAAEAIAENGNLAVNGTGSISGTTGVWTFQRVGGGTISGSASSAAVTSATFTTDYAVSIPFVSPTITVTGVTLTNTTTITANTALSGTGALTQGASSTLNLGGTSGITTLTATASPNTVNYTSTTAAQTLKGTTYHHLVVAKTGQIGTLGAATTVNGNLTISAGSLNDGGFQITGNASNVLTVASGATLRLGVVATATLFPTGYIAANISLPTGSTVVYNSNIAQTIAVPVAYANLSLVATAATTKTIAGPLTVNGTLNVGVNNTLADAGNLITAKSDIVMTGAYTGTNEVLLTGSTSGHALTGGGSYAKLELDDTNGATQSAALTVTSTLGITNGTWTATNTLGVSGTTTINSTLTIASTTGTKTFADMTIASGGTLKFTAAETVAQNGNLTVSSGATMDFTAAGIMNLGGDLTVDGTGAITGTTGLWTLAKVGGGAIGGTASSLTIAGAVTFATSYSIAYPLIMNALTVNAGVTETNPSTVTVNGTLGGVGTFTQGPSTTLNLRSGGITTLNASAAGNIVHYIDGGGTIKGTTYNDLDIAETTGATATISGTVLVSGNLTDTSGTLNPASGTLTVVGTTDIYDTIRDSSGGGSGGNNVFQGLVTVHPGANWTGINGEVVDYHFQNGLIMNGATFVAGSGTYFFETNDQAYSGSLLVDFTHLTIDAIHFTPSLSFDVSNTLTLTTGSVVTPDPAVVVNTAIAQGTLTGTGKLEVTRTAATADFSSQYRFATNILATIEVSYIGTVAQIVSPVAYSNLTIANTNGVSLTSDVTVAGVLALGSNLVTTGTNRMILLSTGSLTRTSGYIVGKLQKAVPIGAPALTFEVGDATNYTPADITFASVTSSGDLLANTTSGDHTDIAASGIAPNKSVNRYWTFGEIGIAFTSYDVTFHFVPADLDPGASTPGFVIAKKDSSWSLLTPGSRTSTSTQATGVTSFSDYQIGKPGLDNAPVASSVSITGTASIGMQLTGHYTYSDAEGDAEGTSTLRWLRNGVAIVGATATTYTLVEADSGATIKFEVTPLATTGTSPGSATQSADFGPILASSTIAETPSSTPEESPASTPVVSPKTSKPTTTQESAASPVEQPSDLTLGFPTTQVMAVWANSHVPLLFVLFLLVAAAVYFGARYWYWILALLRDELYVGHLDHSIDEAKLRDVFEAVGAVRSVKLCERHSQRALHYGFVKMETTTGAHKAIGKLHQKTIAGHALVVKKARAYLFERYPDA